MQRWASRRLCRFVGPFLIGSMLVLTACGKSSQSTSAAPAASQSQDQNDAIASAVAATITAMEQQRAANGSSNGDTTAPQVIGQNDAGSGTDAGNASEQALEIKSNTDAPYVGSLGEGDTDDFYKVTLPAGSVVSIQFQYTSKDGLIRPTFYHDGVDIGGVQIGAGEKWNPTWVLNTTDGGDYVLGVNGGSTYTFNITSQPQQDGGVEGDAGDDSEGARTIAPNPAAAYVGQLGNNDAADFYKVTLPAGSVVSIQFQYTSKNGLIRPTFYHDGVDIGGVQIGAGEKWNPTWVLNTTDGGDYVLGVNGGSTYTFTIISKPQQDGGAEGDAGDESSAARDVPINAAQPYGGILGNNDVADFYRFTLPAAAKIRIKANVDEKSPGQIGITLFKDDVDLGGVGFIRYGSPGTLTGDKAMDAGTYILKVSGDALYTIAITSEGS